MRFVVVLLVRARDAFHGLPTRQERVAHDREQPGARVLALQAVAEPERAQERLLGNIARGFVVAGEPPREVVSGIEMRQHKPLEALAGDVIARPLLSREREHRRSTTSRAIGRRSRSEIALLRRRTQARRGGREGEQRAHGGFGRGKRCPPAIPLPSAGYSRPRSARTTRADDTLLLCAPGLSDEPARTLRPSSIAGLPASCPGKRHPP